MSAEQQATPSAATVNSEDNSSVLDATLQETSQRVQSIRATAAQYLGVPADKVCDRLRIVWKTSNGKPPRTDAEMFTGMSMVARYGLDPVAREVYVTRTKNGLATIIGIDGWIRVLDRTEGFDGFEQIEEWDDKGRLRCVETRIYHKTRKFPTVYRGYAKEYEKQGGFVAGTMPWHMLRIFSLRHAARMFTPIGGSVVTEEEAKWMDAYDDNRRPTNSRSHNASNINDALDAPPEPKGAEPETQETADEPDMGDSPLEPNDADPEPFRTLRENMLKIARNKKRTAENRITDINKELATFQAMLGDDELGIARAAEIRDEVVATIEQTQGELPLEA